MPALSLFVSGYLPHPDNAVAAGQSVSSKLFLIITVEFE
jgi:hypothetical protein